MPEKEKKYTQFERARMIGTRAMQISAGAPPLVKTKSEDPIKIAEEEFEQGLSPLDVRRKLPQRKRMEKEKSE